MKHTDRLIAAQAEEIFALNEICNKHVENSRKILNMLVCIGGPLNDNKHKYNKEQLAIFVRIMDVLGGAEEWDDND